MPVSTNTFKCIVGLCALSLTFLSGTLFAQEEPATEVEVQEVAEVVPTVEEMVAPCAACHGDDGNATIQEYPNLAGQGSKFLVHQMQLMRDVERDVPLMAGQLANYDDDQLQQIADYYAGLPGRIGQASPEQLALGEQIYRGGILEKNVAACTACHAPNGNGNLLAGFPRLSGQPKDYMVLTLKAYREGQRDSDENKGGMMRDIAANLTDTEIHALANYISGLY